MLWMIAFSRSALVKSTLKYTSGGMEETVVTKSGVLKNMDGFDLSLANAAVEAMAKLLANKADATSIAVRRDIDPVTGWDQNGEMIAAAFPRLFMRGGKRLPCGSW